MNNYLFIDGRHLAQNYAEAVRQWFGNEGEIDFQKIKDDCNTSTMFYYDCLNDNQRADESHQDFDDRVEKQESYFDNIPGIVRLGSLMGMGTRRRERRQKKVDILIAVDMLKHAIRKNMQNAILVTGDLDFEPLVEELVDSGVYVELLGDKKCTSRDLIRAASEYRPLSFLDYFRWSSLNLKAEYPIPLRHEGLYQPSNTKHLSTGSVNGDPCSLSEQPDLGYLVTVSPDRTETVTWVSKDLDRLKQFCFLEYGSVEGI